MALCNTSIPRFEKDFQGFLNFLRDGSETYLSPNRFSAVFRTDINVLPLQPLGSLHGNAESLAWQMQPFYRSVVQVVRAAFDLTEDVENAIFWYLNTPLSAFEYRTPDQVVSIGNAELLLRYLVIELNRRREDVME